MSKVSPTARSLAHCRKLRWPAGVVERWIAAVQIRKDLFGCIDLVAIADGGILGIQATTGGNHASRRTKAIAEPRLRAWLKAGGLFEVWSWEKQGSAGKRKLWQLRRERLELEHLPAPPAEPEEPEGPQAELPWAESA